MKNKDEKMRRFLQEKEYPQLSPIAVIILGGMAIAVGLFAMLFTYGVVMMVLNIINWIK